MIKHRSLNGLLCTCMRVPLFVCECVFLCEWVRVPILMGPVWLEGSRSESWGWRVTSGWSWTALSSEGRIWIYPEDSEDHGRILSRKWIDLEMEVSKTVLFWFEMWIGEGNEWGLGAQNPERWWRRVGSWWVWGETFPPCLGWLKTPRCPQRQWPQGWGEARTWGFVQYASAPTGKLSSSSWPWDMSFPSQSSHLTFCFCEQKNLSLSLHFFGVSHFCIFRAPLMLRVTLHFKLWRVKNPDSSEFRQDWHSWEFLLMVITHTHTHTLNISCGTTTSWIVEGYLSKLLPFLVPLPSFVAQW